MPRHPMRRLCAAAKDGRGPPACDIRSLRGSTLHAVAGREGKRGAHTRILVVEDDPDIRELVTLRLRGHGHRTVAVASAPEALDVLAERGPPDVAVLDVMLPG
jgi:PleD family two-component response regulator